MRRLAPCLLLLPLLASACWVTKGEVRQKVEQFEEDETIETADTGED